MTPEMIGILSVGMTLFIGLVGLYGLTLTLWRDVRSDIREVRRIMQGLDKRVSEVEKGVAVLDHRVEVLDNRVEGLGHRVSRIEDHLKLAS